MITLFIFYIHTIVAVTAFTRRWQEEGLWEGILAVGFVALIFAVGWSMTTVLVQLFMEKEGFGIWFDRDTAALVLLTVLEAIFYYALVKRRRRKEKLIV
jgi:uncharacterized membrane protein